MSREIAVICQEQEAFRIEVQPSHRNEPGQVFWQGLENRWPPLRVFVRRNAALRLVIAPEPGCLPHCERLPVNKHLIRRRDVERRAFYDSAINGHAFFPNQDFGVAP